MKIKSTLAAPALVLVVLLLLFATQVINPGLLGMDTNPYLAIVIIQLFVFALPSVFFCRLRGGKYEKSLRIRLFRVKHIAFMIFALMFLTFGSTGINYLMYRLIPDAYASSAVSSYTTYVEGSVFGGIYIILAFAVLPALCEEFLFRGIIMHEYESRGVFLAIMFSSLSFAMCHFSFVRLPVYLFGGIVLAYVAYATRSIIASFTVHAVYNILSLYLENAVYRVVSRQGIVLFVFAVVGLSLLFAVLLFGEAEKLYAGYSIMNIKSDYISKKKKTPLSPFAEAILSPIFILVAVAYIIIASIV